jgi:vacuolar iron transporter family protein
VPAPPSTVTPGRRRHRRVALFATGATAGVLTGGPVLRRGLRQLSIGFAAVAVTYGLG